VSSQAKQRDRLCENSIAGATKDTHPNTASLPLSRAGAGGQAARFAEGTANDHGVIRPEETKSHKEHRGEDFEFEDPWCTNSSATRLNAGTCLLSFSRRLQR